MIDPPPIPPHDGPPPPMPSKEELITGYQNLMAVHPTDDAPPMVMFCSQTHNFAVGVQPGDCEGVELPTIIEQVIGDMAGFFGKPHWVVVTNEVFAKKTNDPEELARIYANRENGDAEGGYLRQQKAAGDAEVMEAVLVTALASDGECFTITKPFERVGGEIIWGEALVHPPHGPMCQAIAKHLA